MYSRPAPLKKIGETTQCQVLTITLKLLPMSINQIHNMDFENVKFVGLEANCHERLFLEAWHSTEAPNAGNDHIKIPEAYKCIARA